MRSRPEVSDDSKKLEPLLQRGDHVFVVKGPVAGSGYRWYEVQPLGDPGDQERPGPFGWVAAADKTGEPWIKTGAFVCPKAPTTIQALNAVEPWTWVACLGRRSIAFPARLADPEATCGVDVGWTVTPEWLASTCSHPSFIVFPAESTATSFDAVIDPGLDTRTFHPGPEEKDWTAVTVTGHYDHKAAPTCKGISHRAWRQGAIWPRRDHHAVPRRIRDHRHQATRLAGLPWAATPRRVGAAVRQLGQRVIEHERSIANRPSDNSL